MNIAAIVATVALIRLFFSSNQKTLPLPGGRAAGRRFAPPPPPLHGVPSLPVAGEPGLSVRALSGEFVRQAVDGLVVGQDGADVLLEERREPQTHAVDLHTTGSVASAKSWKQRKVGQAAGCKAASRVRQDVIGGRLTRDFLLGV